MQVRTLALAMLLAAGGEMPAAAQGLPDRPFSLADGRVVIGADVTATFASADPGFFNYTEYEYSALRNVRLGVTAEVRANDRFQVLAEVRSEHGNAIQPFALYARVRPWPARRFDIHIGRIPPTFGLFGRGTYGSANILIGSPVAYQYLTSLRPDALPSSADDLIRMRGRGWLSDFGRGNRAPDRGLPLINSFRWDTGVQLHSVAGIVEWTGAVTTGSLSNPRVSDDNDGRQIAGRVVLRPAPAVAVGVSAARGAFLSRSIASALALGRSVEDGVQQAIAADLEYSVGRFLARSEVIRSEWQLPMTSVQDDDLDLSAVSLLGEARYRIVPGVQVAARAERLGFNRVASSNGLVKWEAPVRRYEIGAAWSLRRNVTVKGSWQYNVRNGGRVRNDGLGAAQIVYWF